MPFERATLPQISTMKIPTKMITVSYWSLPIYSFFPGHVSVVGVSFLSGFFERKKLIDEWLAPVLHFVSVDYGVRGSMGKEF